MAVLRSVVAVVAAVLVALVAAVARPSTGPAVPTYRSLPAANYPWVQPIWSSVGTVTVPQAPASTISGSYLEPVWTSIDGVVVPRLR